MTDARTLQFGIDFDTEEAQSNVGQLTESLYDVEEAQERVQIGARNTGGAIANMGARSADSIRDVSRAADNLGSDFADSNHDIGSSFRRIGAEADSFGSAFRQNMLTSLRSGETLASSFKSGMGGAFAFTKREICRIPKKRH